jgi:hypothetical protein
VSFVRIAYKTRLSSSPSHREMIRFDTRQIIVTPLWLGQAPTAPLKKSRHLAGEKDSLTYYYHMLKHVEINILKTYNIA